MNEKIELLFNQALDTAVPYTWTNLDHEEVKKIVAEFAILMVQDCSTAFKPALRSMISRTEAYQMVKDHFKL